MTERATTLLPCPFCGEAPGFSRRQDEDLSTHNIVWWDRVYCMNCDVGFSWPEHSDVTAAIQWNTRAPAGPELARVHAMNKTLRNFLTGIKNTAETALLDLDGECVPTNKEGT